VEPLPFTSAAFDSLDAELMAVFLQSRTITPDLVKAYSLPRKPPQSLQPANH
jgi:hypothetical protein